MATTRKRSHEHEHETNNDNDIGNENESDNEITNKSDNETENEIEIACGNYQEGEGNYFGKVGRGYKEHACPGSWQQLKAQEGARTEAEGENIFSPLSQKNYHTSTAPRREHDFRGPEGSKK